MNIATVRNFNLWRTVMIDVALLAVACLIPTLTHLFALPLYQLNPMLLVLLTGMLLVENRLNGFVLAILLPVVSMLAVGMPAPAKAFCMAVEFSMVIFASGLLLSRCRSRLAVFGAMVAAMLCGKVVYYGLKALIMAPSVLVTTPVLTQFLVVVAAALLFALFAKRQSI